MSRFRAKSPASPVARRVAALAIACAAVAATVAAPAASASVLPSPAGPAAAKTGHRLWIGAAGSSSDRARLGGSVQVHSYATAYGKVPDTRMISMYVPNATWAQVANAQPGSKIYDAIVRWAHTLGARKAPVYFNYHHEPEATGSAKFGNSTQFKAAYRHVVTIMRSHGAKNVRYVWQMTAYSFTVGSSDPRAAYKWYPGANYVDDVAGDAYNWYTTSPGHGNWVPLSQVAANLVSWARAHHKHVILGEFGCAPNYRRAAWLKAAHTYFHQHRWIYDAAFYFQRYTAADWRLKTSAEIAAFRGMIGDSATFRN